MASKLAEVDTVEKNIDTGIKEITTQVAAITKSLNIITLANTDLDTAKSQLKVAAGKDIQSEISTLLPDIMGAEYITLDKSTFENALDFLNGNAHNQLMVEIPKQEVLYDAEIIKYTAIDLLKSEADIVTKKTLYDPKPAILAATINYIKSLEDMITKYKSAILSLNKATDIYKTKLKPGLETIRKYTYPSRFLGKATSANVNEDPLYFLDKTKTLLQASSSNTVIVTYNSAFVRPSVPAPSVPPSLGRKLKIGVVFEKITDVANQTEIKKQITDYINDYLKTIFAFKKTKANVSDYIHADSYDFVLQIVISDILYKPPADIDAVINNYIDISNRGNAGKIIRFINQGLFGAKTTTEKEKFPLSDKLESKKTSLIYTYLYYVIGKDNTIKTTTPKNSLEFIQDELASYISDQNTTVPGMFGRPIRETVALEKNSKLIQIDVPLDIYQ